MKTFRLIFISCFITWCFAEQQRVLSKDSLLSVKSILEHHDKPNVNEAHTKHFKGETLAYVTPWNNRGKQNEPRFTSEKLTTI